MKSKQRMNVRVLFWHFKLSPDWRLSVTYNDYHAKLEHGWFAVYQFNLFAKQSEFDQDTATK